MLFSSKKHNQNTDNLHEVFQHTKNRLVEWLQMYSDKNIDLFCCINYLDLIKYVELFNMKLSKNEMHGGLSLELLSTDDRVAQLIYASLDDFRATFEKYLANFGVRECQISAPEGKKDWEQKTITELKKKLHDLEEELEWAEEQYMNASLARYVFPASDLEYYGEYKNKIGEWVEDLDSVRKWAKEKGKEEYYFKEMESLEKDIEELKEYIGERKSNFLVSDNILYVYKKSIGCIKNNHDIVSVKATIETLRHKEVDINVNYCKACDKYFISHEAYERYREKYHIMYVHFRIIQNNSFFNTSTLASESPLMLCGYNVRQADGYTDETRQNILANIMDKQIIKKYEIIEYLSFFIRVNGSSSKNGIALEKWKKDLEFVQQYGLASQGNVKIGKIVKA